MRVTAGGFSPSLFRSTCSSVLTPPEDINYCCLWMSIKLNANAKNMSQKSLYWMCETLRSKSSAYFFKRLHSIITKQQSCQGPFLLTDISNRLLSNSSKHLLILRIFVLFFRHVFFSIWRILSDWLPCWNFWRAGTPKKHPWVIVRAARRAYLAQLSSLVKDHTFALFLCCTLPFASFVSDMFQPKQNEVVSSEVQLLWESIVKCLSKIECIN